MIPLGGPMGRHKAWVVAVLAVMTAACTGGGAPKPTPTTTPHRGGQAIFGAEGWPECLNPINQCSAFPWTWYTVLEHVLPRAMQLDPKGNFVASPLLQEAPSLKNGLVTENPFTITYKISDRAVWADGSPITSADFDFTWRAILNTTGAHTTVGYNSIDSIEISDPKSAVIKFKEVFVDWPDLFGGVYQGILEKAAFPKFASDPNPNLKHEMEDSFPFSGGPWILRSWSNRRAILVRNPRYFGRVPQLDQVTFVPKTDQLRELGALFSGEVAAIYPGPQVWPLIDQAKVPPGINFRGDDGTAFGALWFNAHERPLNDPLVRSALMYAVDRQRVIDAVVKTSNPRAEVLNCGFLALPGSPGCRTRPFERFTYDPARAVGLLEQAGYDCSTFPCTNKGKPLEVPYLTTGLSVLETTAQQTQQMIIEGALAAGFRLKVVILPSLLGAQTMCPYSHMPMTGCTVVVPSDQGITGWLGCGAIPSAENQYVGRNRIGWCNQEADRFMKESDRELDPTKRLELLERVYELEASDMIGLPLFVLQATVGWRSDKITGPIKVWNSSPYSVFFNINEWYLR